MHRPLLTFVVFFISGIVTERFINYPLALTAVINMGFIAAGFLCLNKKRCSVALVCFSALLFGYNYTAAVTAAPVNDISGIARYYRGPVVLEGVIVSDIERKKFYSSDKLNFRLKVERFRSRWGWKNKDGLIQVSLFQNRDLFYGNRIRIEGRLHRPFEFKSEGNFSYRKYLSNKGIRYILSVKKDAPLEIMGNGGGSSLKRVSLKLRAALKETLHTHLSENEAGVMQAILLGDRSGIPKHIRELFVRTGTAHILAISGLHIGIVSALIFLCLKLCRLPLKFQYALTIVFVTFYIFLTGGRPSVIRAGVMTNTILFGFLIERETDTLHSLSLAAAGLLLANPLNVFDIGFQLSFTSILGILFVFSYFGYRIRSWPYIAEHAWAERIALSALVSLGAWIGVSGFVAYYFHIITPISIFANLFVIPLMFAIVALGFGLLVWAWILPAAAGCFAICLKTVLSVMIFATYVIDKIPFGHIFVDSISYWHTITYYVFIAAAMFFLRRREIDKIRQL